MPHHLLLADDSVTIQRVIKLTFADEDVEVVAVGDGDQAVAALDKAAPDIVLADVAMPGKSGYDVAQYIRHTPRLAHIPVVLLTGAFEPIDEARAAEVGCDGVLAKPFEPEAVVSRVRELLSRARPQAAAVPIAPAVAAVASVASAAAPAYAASAVSAGSGGTLANLATFAQVAHAAATPASGPFAPIKAVPSPVPMEPPARTKGPDIDAYFDRLDQAFANLAASPKPPAPQPEPAAPVFETAAPAPLPGPQGPLAGMAASRPGPHAPAASDASSLADVFEGLLAAPAPAPVPAAGPGPVAVPPAPLPFKSPAAVERAPAPHADAALSDAQIDLIVGRTLDRLQERMTAGNLPEIVAQVAERLVRDEIAKIKSRL